MGYISVADGEGFSVVVSKGLVFYAILAIPLVIITVAIYLVSEILNRRTAKTQGGLDKETNNVLTVV
jgi:hypothetical protein